MPHSLSELLAQILNLLVTLIIIEVVISWLIYFRKVSPTQPLVIGLRKIVNPLLDPVRRVIPPRSTGGIDISPMIVILALQFLSRFLTGG